MIKERPLSFMPDMTRAERAGIKTMTRRAVKLADARGRWDETGYQSVTDSGIVKVEWNASRINQIIPCPYGQPGDYLWVREAWRSYKQMDDFPPREFGTGAPIHYEADFSADPVVYGKYRPAMFMCRWMSRTLLEVISVRVERLQDISEADCIAEGAPGGHGSIPGYAYSATPLEHYENIWRTINGAESWLQNPWVWVVEFKRVKP